MAGEPRGGPDLVLWYPEAPRAHLVDDFCSGANLFCSSDHLEGERAERSPAGRTMTIDEVAEIGRRSWGEAAVELGISPPDR